MESTVTCARQGEKLIFYVSGVFDYALALKLKNLARTQQKAKECVIDLKMATYINSSAFGALLFVRETFGVGNNDICIVNAPPQVLELLKMANFQQLFKIL